jgi:hypothetical protein
VFSFEFVLGRAIVSSFEVPLSVKQEEHLANDQDKGHEIRAPDVKSVPALGEKV